MVSLIYTPNKGEEGGYKTGDNIFFCYTLYFYHQVEFQFISVMAFRRNFQPAVANSANVKAILHNSPIDDGTAMANQIAERDLRFWIPHAAPLLPQGVKRIKTLETWVFLFI